MSTMKKWTMDVNNADSEEVLFEMETLPPEDLRKADLQDLSFPAKQELEANSSVANELHQPLSYSSDK